MMPRPTRGRALRTAALFLLALAPACAPRQPVTAEPDPASRDPVLSPTEMRWPPTTGREVLARMRAQFPESWSGTLRYVQQNTLYRSDGGETQSEWIRQIAAPGRQRIDYLPLTSRSGVLYEGGRAHVFIDGKRVQSEARVDPRQLLVADIAHLPVDSTARLLESLGFALDSLHTGTWEGRPVYVIGASAGDSARPQLWVDAERFLLLRLIYPETGGTRTIVTDTRFGRWAEHDGVPVPEEIVQVRDGTPVWREEAQRIEVNATLPEGTFDPAKWRGEE